MKQQTPRRQSLDLTPHRTPNSSRQRSYLSFHHSQGIKHDQLPAHHISETPHMIEQIYKDEIEEDNKVIWGTNIEVRKTQRGLTDFIKKFQFLEDENSVPQYIYMTTLSNFDLDMLENNMFVIKATHLQQWQTELYYQLIHYPAEIITILDQIVKSLYQQIYIETLDPQDYRLKQEKMQKKNLLMVSITNLPQITLMRSLNHKHINKLISFRGIVIRCSDIYPEMKTAMFQCLKCKAQVPIDLVNAKVSEPKICTNCKYRDTFQIVHSFCQFTDKQYIKIQQLPEYVPQGQTPTSMSVVCYDNNVNGMRPGDRVQIVGLFRAQGRKVSRTRSALYSVFSTFTDMISFRILEENKFKTSLSDNKTIFSEQDLGKIFEIAGQQNVIQDLVQSFASSISGHQNIKKGLLAQIFGGTHKQFDGRGRFRSDINVCLVGDPSTAKSQLLKQVHTISPRGIYTSGKGSSAVGLTANVRRDPQTREFILESGALVLSDLGICCIDEFDKMDENSKLILLEAMEQQTISVAKAGIVCSLNSRTSILSAANPISSKYDIKKSVVDNIHLHPALLSRFDLIYIILDIPNQKTDRFLASHILSLYSRNNKNSKIMQPKIPRDVMTKYITYAKQYVHPKITQEAGKKLTQCYLQMRNAGSKKTISATIRQLESLIRISEAFAKMKLSAQVSQQDVLMSFELIKDALKQSATDPTTGMIDMDVIVTGTSSASKKRVDSIVVLLRDLFQANQSQFLGKKIAFDTTLEKVCSKWKTIEVEVVPKQEEVRDALLKLQKEGIINIFGSDRRRPLFQYLSQQN